MEFILFEIMNYSIYNKKNEIIQTYNLRYRSNIEPTKTPLGKILSELINFDYNEFYMYYNSLTDKRKRNYSDFKINGICKETENVLKQLLLPDLYIKQSQIISIINNIANDIKYIIKSNNTDHQFVEFYFDRIYNIKVKRKQFSIERYSSTPVAPVLSQYNFDNIELFKLLSNCNGNIPRRSDEQRLEAYDILLDYLKNTLSDIHYSICKKLSIKGLMASREFRLNDLNCFNFTEEEKYEYIRLVYKYEQGEIYDIHSLKEFLIISFIHCCKENIKTEECSECGNIYFKYGKNKYCSESCKIKAHKKQEIKRVYKYISKDRKIYELNYNTVLKSFQQKIQRIIDYINDPENTEYRNITENSKAKITNGLLCIKRFPRLEKEIYEEKIKNIKNDEYRQIAENELAKWLYKIKCFYQKKNSLLNEYKRSVENQNDFTIKIPILTNDFKVDYQDFVILCPKYD